MGLSWAYGRYDFSHDFGCAWVGRQDLQPASFVEDFRSVPPALSRSESLTPSNSNLAGQVEIAQVNRPKTGRPVSLHGVGVAGKVARGDVGLINGEPLAERSNACGSRRSGFVLSGNPGPSLTVRREHLIYAGPLGCVVHDGCANDVSAVACGRAGADFFSTCPPPLRDLVAAAICRHRRGCLSRSGLHSRRHVELRFSPYYGMMKIAGPTRQVKKPKIAMIQHAAVGATLVTRRLQFLRWR